MKIKTVHQDMAIGAVTIIFIFISFFFAGLSSKLPSMLLPLRSGRLLRGGLSLAVDLRRHAPFAALFSYVRDSPLTPPPSSSEVFSDALDCLFKRCPFEPCNPSICRTFIAVRTTVLFNLT